MKVIQAKKRGGIKLQLLGPVGLGLLVLLASSIFVLKQLQQKSLNGEVNEYAEHVLDIFNNELSHESQSLEGLIGILARDPELQQLWLKKDRQALLNYANNFYKNTCANQDITHYYFHNIDRTCFLRVHQPERYGDTIERLTMEQAVSTGKPAWGIELGPLGTFTLRFVQPWWIDGRIQGYLELGKEIDHISNRISELLEVDLFFIINKDYLDRLRWEEGMAMLGRQARWDEFQQFIIASKTMDGVPEQLHHYLTSLDECESEEHLESVLVDITMGQKEFRGKPVCLDDAGGRDVGDILVLVDISDRQVAIHRLSSMLIAAYGVMFCTLLILLYYYFRKIKQKLNTTYDNLNREIQEHKHSKRQIEQQNRFLNNVIESLSHPFYIIDANTHRVIIANSATHNSKPGTETTCYSMTHRQDSPCKGTDEPCPLEIVKQTRKPATVEHVHYDRQGHRKHVEVHCYPIFSADGELTHVIEYSLDITERKRIQENLKIAKDKAVEASRLKSEFLANMSHELRTPLNSIIGFSELLSQEDSLNANQKDYTETLLHNSRSLLNLVNDILDVSKIEANKIILEYTDFKIEDIAANIETLLRPQADAQGIELKFHIAKGLPETIRSDRLRLKQCVINLVSNAIKFTPAGHIDIYIGTEELLGKQYLRMDVKDTGIGIPESKLDTIFEAFTQADGSTTRKYGGTGLGLTITQKLITLLGGNLLVSSKVGKGSIFSIQLPVTPSSKTTHDIQTAPEITIAPATAEDTHE